MKNTLLLLLCALTFIGCTPESRDNFNDSVSVFFLGVFQIVNLIIVGLPGLIMSIAAAVKGNKIVRTLGLIFMIAFVLLGLWGFVEVNNVGPRRPDIYIIFIIEFLFAGSGFGCLIAASNKKEVKPKAEIDLLD
jgi:quinol-cytochrome oxidoreductase complex cytochrome b subunit